MQAIMKTDVILLSTPLQLQAGQAVEIIPADNLPQGGYFARPLDGKWLDGLDHDVLDSIHVTETDIER